MNASTISADIISYTSLSQKDKAFLNVNLNELLFDLKKKFARQKFYGRIVHGDYIECAMLSPQYALRIALMIKTLVKSTEVTNVKDNDNRIRYFREYGVRIAIAVAPLDELNSEKEIIDGEAIYLSGRTIKNMSTSNKERVVVKDSMYFRSLNVKLQDEFDTLISLLDAIISKCSQKQCEVLYLKLSGLTEKEICEKTGKNQSTISQHSSAASWNAIEKSVNHFEKHVL